MCVCVCVSGSGVHSPQAGHDGTHRRDDPQPELCHLLAAALPVRTATQVPASRHAQGMYVCMCVCISVSFFVRLFEQQVGQ